MIRWVMLLVQRFGLGAFRFLGGRMIWMLSLRTIDVDSRARLVGPFSVDFR